MTPGQIDRVFGRGRLKMVTGEHVEVFREAAAAGERRRYTKRFLKTNDGDFAHWTEREWRILARLIGHGVDCVPDVVQFDRGSTAGTQLVQTYDAGVTVDQWATLLPLMRDARVYRHAFEDCAHWWALAHHSLIALKKIHQLELVHLDVKGDNVCIPLGPATFDPDAPGERLQPRFGHLALIDFAFALVSGEALAHPLPIGWQRDYDYQSPRLLKALEEGRNGDLRLTRQLDWRCDIYSLAAMLKRYLPEESALHPSAGTGWNAERYDAAKAIILSLREHHDRDAPHAHPHAALISATGTRLRERDLAASLASGWTLGRDIDVVPASASPLTPMTRLAPSIRVFVSPRARVADSQIDADASRDRLRSVFARRDDAGHVDAPPVAVSRAPLVAAVMVALALGTVAAPLLFPDVARAVLDRAHTWAGEMLTHTDPAASSTVASKAEPEPPTQSAAPTQVAAAPTGAPTAQTSPEAEPSSPANADAAVESVPAAAGTKVTAEQPAASVDPSPDPQPRQPPVSFAQAAPRSGLPTADGASPSSKKGKTNSRPSPPMQSPKPAPTTTAQRFPPAQAPNRIASNASRVPPAPVTSPVVSAYTRSLARAQAAPQSSQIPQSNRAADRASAVQVTTVQPPPSPSSEPSNLANDQQEQGATADVAEAPTPMPVAPPPPAAHPSRAERTEDRGWLSRLLRLVKNKAAPIEDRRLQAAAPKNESAPAALQHIPRDDPKPSQGDAWHAVDLAEKTPAQSAAPTARGMAPPFASSETAAGDAVFAVEAQRALREVVPRIASQAQSEVARVLWAAANADDPAQDRAVIEAAQSIRVADAGSGLAQKVAPAEARRLNAEASDAYWSSRNRGEALELQLKAFGANPYDAEIAGNLALLHLKQGRLQPETARQLALVAIAYHGARYRTGRFEDWTTFAIASALTGRTADARNALFATVALSRNIERSCRSALAALSNYGERLRDPVDAMFYRIHAQGRSNDSPYCSRPTRWAATSALSQ